MNRGPFSAKAAATSYRDHACKEFRNHHPGAHKAKISPERNLDLRNPAAGRVAAEKSKNQTRNDCCRYNCRQAKECEISRGYLSGRHFPKYREEDFGALLKGNCSKTAE